MTTMLNIIEASKMFIPLQIERTIAPLLSILVSPCYVLCPLLKVHSTSIHLDQSGERKGLQPSLSPIVQVYATLKSSFVAVFAEMRLQMD
jgi:uncharacterized protein YunC (DUF1805 family)